MILHCRVKKSKQKKPTKQQVADYDAFCKKHGLGKYEVKKHISVNTVKKSLSPKVPEHRKTNHIPSFESDMSPCTVPVNSVKVYTGDKMLGIGTLHKSNAVPIFSVEDAKHMANMRR
jgi:hypothetical protein